MHQTSIFYVRVKSIILYTFWDYSIQHSFLATLLERVNFLFCKFKVIKSVNFNSEFGVIKFTVEVSFNKVFSLKYVNLVTDEQKNIFTQRWVRSFIIIRGGLTPPCVKGFKV